MRTAGRYSRPLSACHQKHVLLSAVSCMHDTFRVASLFLRTFCLGTSLSTFDFGALLLSLCSYAVCRFLLHEVAIGGLGSLRGCLA